MNDDFINEIYKKYLNLVTFVVKSKIYSPSNFDDISQCVSEVFVRAMESKEIEKHTDVHKWLTVTAKFVTFSYNRKMKKDIINTISFEENMIKKDIATIVSSELDYKTCLTNIKNELSQKEIELFHLKYFEDFSNKQISLILGISEGSVNTAAVRLKIKIKKIIKDMLQS